MLGERPYEVLGQPGADLVAEFTKFRWQIKVHQTRSIRVPVPMPPPTHIVIRP